jgi:hypothetical protein
MLHTLYRFACSAISWLGIVSLFGAWGLLAALMSNEFVCFPFAVFTGAVFFAPAAFINTWQNVGD